MGLSGRNPVPPGSPFKLKPAIENEIAIAQAEREKQVTIKQSEAEAERVRIAAEAQAKSTMIAAQADADAMKLAADAQAYRLKQIAAQITDKTILSTLAESWNGELPGVLGTGVAGILDLKEAVQGDGTN